MLVAGIDIGAATAKAVIFNNGNMVGSSVIPTGASVARAAEEVAKLVREQAGIWDKFDYIVSTGYGRNNVPFKDKAVSEILCHGKGAHALFPDVRTIVDIGGQDSKVIGLDDNGIVASFVMNDKCAAGTGRFFEVMTSVLEIGYVEEFGPLALNSNNPADISSTCTIFAESEVVSLRAEGRPVEDLLAGIIVAVVHRVVVMGKQVGYRPHIAFTGGVAKNVGVKKYLEKEIGLEIFVPPEPQIIGAFGAALIARDELRKQG